MGKYKGLEACLVWDGGDAVHIPAKMGQPKPGQMEGTTAERLTELCGRVCYDSLGVGRPSSEYFDHISQVGHLSIAEHFNVTIELRGTFTPAHFMAMLNRPWVWVTYSDCSRIRITTNLRGIREWESWSTRLGTMMPAYPTAVAHCMGLVFRDLVTSIAPRIVKGPPKDEVWPTMKMFGLDSAAIVPPENNAERWISVYMVGSRGFSHELVRHGDFTAISQRSTRYCEESESDWVIHPLVQEYLADGSVPISERMAAAELTGDVMAKARHAYRWWVDKLVPYVTPRLGADPYAKTTARKQARGAARGFLGNALETEVILSGSVLQWGHMFNMRCASAADAEIRNEFVEVLPLLKASRYGAEFDRYVLEPAPDGVGMSLAGGGAK